MNAIWRSGICAVLVFGGMLPVFPQGLFESSQSGYHENRVSNSLTLGGFIRSVGYLSTLSENDRLYLQSGYGQAGLVLDARLQDWATARAELRFRAGSEFQQTLAEWEIREAYVDLSRGSGGIRFGKLIDPWGKGTFFNPVDKITPLDPTVRSPDEDDMHLGFWGLQGHLNLGSYMTLTGTWKPVYQSSVLLIDPVPLPDYVQFLEPWDPGVTFREGSYGFNFDLHLPAIDAGLYGFVGYHHWPGIAFESISMDMTTFQPTLLELKEHPYRIRMAGIDFSLPAGSWILRGEGSWQQPVEDHELYEYVPFPELAYTAEVERSLGPLDVITGYYGKYILDFHPAIMSPSLSSTQDRFSQVPMEGITLTMEGIDELVRQQIGAFNRLYNYQLEEQYHTAFLLIRGDFFHEVLECSFPLIYNITTEEWTVQPKLSWRALDGLEVSAGFTGLYGPSESLYDMVGPALNAGFLSMKITF